LKEAGSAVLAEKLIWIVWRLVLELLCGVILEVAVFFSDGGDTSSSFFTRKRGGSGVSVSSFFTRLLDVPDEPASFGRRRQVLRATVEGACGSPMTMPPVVRGVLGVDEEERDEEDVTLSIRRSAVS
jgi:hypothetical protein